MAIDHIPYPDRNDLAKAEKAFYPVKIPVSHWQLRHYISTPERDHLYYASAQDVYCLNTATKKRKHIATLPFEARCTASGYGWVCVGGEDEGHFAAIKLDGTGRSTLDVDSTLPLSGLGQNIGRRAPTVKVERIGEEIVNSISIHRIQDEEAHLDDIVAVLTNNDRTVRLYSLPSGQETKCIVLSFAINHATISPDGKLLVAVGDYNQAYFFRREIVATPPQIPKPHNRLTSASVRWEQLCKVTLHASQPDATVGYFTTAWSQSGHLIAVGSEGGYITILDADILCDLSDPDYNENNRQEAVVAVVPSSRPDVPSPHPGAVRTLMFSPDPWDLLVWSEDQGRICVGDLRTGLKSRQVISLEPTEETLRRIEFEDIPSDENVFHSTHLRDVSPATIDELEADLLRRYRTAPENASAVNFATEYIEVRRRQRAARQELAARSQASSSRQSASAQSRDDGQRGLSTSEQDILDTLRTSRQREEARAGGHIPRSVNYTTPDMFTGNSRNANPTQAEAARSISDLLSSVHETFPELSRTHAANPRPSGHETGLDSALPALHALQDSVWGSSSRSNLSRLPRRRQSVVLSPPASANAASAPGSPSSREREQSSALGREQAEEEEQEDGDEGVILADESEDGNPWRIIEEQLAETARGPLFEGSARAQARAEATENSTAEPERPRTRDDIALQDFNMQLTLLEDQNRRRLELTARERGELTREFDQNVRDSIRRAEDRAAQDMVRRRAQDPSSIAERDRDAGEISAQQHPANGRSQGRRSQTNNGTNGIDRERALAMAEARRLAAFTDRYDDRRRTIRQYAIPSGRDVGVRTAGLAMSPDGRTIWAACEEGIFEIDILAKRRMFWPAFEAR